MNGSAEELSVAIIETEIGKLSLSNLNGFILVSNTRFEAGKKKQMFKKI
jgi:hypothetical protein